MLKRLRRDNCSPFFYCLFIFLISRIAIYYVAYLVNLYAHFHLPIPEWFVQWDSNWYLMIVEKGYSTLPAPSHVTDASIALHLNYPFFPLYPLLIKALDLISPLSDKINGQIISQIFFLLSLPLFYRLLQHYFDKKICMYGIILLCFSPFNIYFSSVYTESVYLFLSLAAWLALIKKNWLLLGVFGLLLSLTRPTGVLLLLPVLWVIAEDIQANSRIKIQYFFSLLIPVGLLLFMAYLWHHMGDPLAFIHAVKAWCPGGVFHNLATLRNFLYVTLHFKKMDALVFIFSIYLSVILYKRNFKKEMIFFLAPLLSALASESFESIARYAACSFLFYFALILISKDSPKRQMLISSITFFLLPIYILGWLAGASYFT